MNTPEQNAWSSLRPVLAAAGLDPRRVENVVGPGHPDVDYAGGNIELKAMESFPVRDTTVIQVPEFSGEQAGWLYQRQNSGGRAWLIVRVGPEWFLFNGVTAMQVWKGLTQFQWRQRAQVSGKMAQIKTRLIDALKEDLK